MNHKPYTLYIMKKFITNTFVWTLTALASLAWAQEAETPVPETSTEVEDEAPSFAFSGTVDTYFRYNFNESQGLKPGTSFADHPGFAIGMANLIASYEGEKVGFVADLVFGPRGADAVFGSTGSSNIVNQLYAYINLSESLTVTLGNFNTFLGYEVISPAANFNYSTSYMFSYGPFSHTGIKADWDLGNDWSLMLGLMNPTDVTESNPVDQYMTGIQLGYKGQYLNYLAGMGYSQIDYTGGFNLSDAFYLGINATSASVTDDQGFAGVALYPQLTASESFSIGLRGEFFSETDGFGALVNTGDADNLSLTLTGNYTQGNLTLKPEIRLDSASEEIFVGAESSKSLASFVLAAVYGF